MARHPNAIAWWQIPIVIVGGSLWLFGTLAGMALFKAIRWKPMGAK